MLSPSTHAWAPGETLGQHLEHRGIDRRDFLAFCRNMAIVLGAGETLAPTIAHALEVQKRPTVIWLELQECTGCVESITRSGEPDIGTLVLDLISLDSSDTLMAAAGAAAEKARLDSMRANKGKYLLVVTGSVPLAEDGIYTMIAGRTAREHLEEAARDAAAVIAVGACAHFGSVQAARPNPTQAVGVRDIVKDKPVLVIAGCPPVPDVITASVVHFLTFGSLPKADAQGRPLFAYGARIHDQCPRRANFDAGQFVQHFDDEGARQGWCLYEVGCKGPQTFSPCPVFQWNLKTSWPIGAGHPCIGCTEAHFWDTMTPFYQRLPDIAGAGVERTIDRIGVTLAGLTVAGVAAHAAYTTVRRAGRGKELPVVPPGGPSTGGQ